MMRDPYTLSGFLDSLADDATDPEDKAGIEEAAAALRHCGDLLRRSHSVFLPHNAEFESHAAWRPRGVVLLGVDEVEWLRTFVESDQRGQRD